MKKDRTPEIHFYEWRVSVWLASETRDRLDATGRGIYRELLDHCYTQGSFPDDPEWICKRCACTSGQFQSVWEIIARHFPISNRAGYRWNMLANITRKEYHSYVRRQQNRRKSGLYKPHGISSVDGAGLNSVQHVLTGIDSGSVATRPNGDGNVTATATATLRQRQRQQEVETATASAESAPPVKFPPAPTQAPTAIDLDGQPSPRFEEAWKLYPRKTGKPGAAHWWVSLVTISNEAAVVDCLNRFLASADVARGFVPKSFGDWLQECARDSWECDWPAPTVQKTKQQLESEAWSRA
jgi:hypothetical protein